MKIFGWMHSKLTGKQEHKDSLAAANTNNTLQDYRREEFNDWPHGLLTIGTFGNNNLNQEPDKPDDHLQDVTLEEVNKLEKEITQLLEKQQLDGILDTQDSQYGNVFDDDRSGSNRDDRISTLERSTSVVLRREKDIRADQKKGSIGKKSLYFILKKKLICRGGFAPTSILRDISPDQSRMEKILRAILNKKIYPQNSNSKATVKKYLETNKLHDSDSDDEMFEVENDGSKWVKTDSDYIVLEI